MNNNEYNSFNEYNKTNEYKKFDAIQTTMNSKESFSTKQESLEAEEYGYNKDQNKINSKKTDSGIIKKMIQKVTESSVSLTSGIAGTVTAAVASIVVISSLINAPHVELKNLTAGYDYVSYNLYIDEMDENIDYFAVISNNFETYKYELIEGENQNTIYNLRHDMKYNLSVLGIDEANNEQAQYFNYTFYTTVETKNINVYWIVEGVEVETDTIEYGEEPTYDGETPVKDFTLEYDYTFSNWKKSVDETTGDITYTAEFESVLHEYTATYNQLSASEIIIDYGNEDYYVLNFNTAFENSLDSRLSYRITLTDVENNQTYTYEGTSDLAQIDVPIDVSSLAITYESIGTYNGEEKVFETIDMPDVLSISNISVDIGDEFTLVATDTYQVPIIINLDKADEEVYNTVTLLVTYDDLSTENVVIKDLMINDMMMATIHVPAYCSNLTIDYTVELLGANGHNECTIKGNKEVTLETTYELVTVSADINEYENASFEFRYHFIDQETTLAVKDVSTSTVSTLYEGYNSIDVPLNTGLSENEFTYYLSSVDGEAKETEISVIIPIVRVSADYQFNSINPGDAVMTFNDDGTMNIYLSTFFETEDPDVWYLVKYTDFNSSKVYDVKYTESVAYIEGIPYSSYGLQYYVYKTIDNIDYLLRYTIPSGGIELIDGNICDVEFTENTDNTVDVSVSFSYFFNIQLDSIVLLVDGNEYAISSENITYDQDYYEYTFSYTLASMPSELIIQYDVSFNYEENYELVSAEREIKGSQYKTLFDIVNKEDNYENE